MSSLETLTIEHLKDIHTALFVALDHITNVKTPNLQKRRAHLIKSLKHSMSVIEQRIKDLEFEQDKNPLPY